jgi:RNA polymerase sigma-70 factor, ECF subfamily
VTTTLPAAAWPNARKPPRSARIAAPPESRPSSESELLRRLRAGDERAFEEIVRADGGRMLATARRILRSEDDAREAVQDAFLSALRALPHFVEESRLSTWMHRILINAALAKLRSRRHHPEESIDDLLPRFDLDGRRCEDQINSFEDGESKLERAELHALVHTCIGRLPEGYRIVLVLRDIEELGTQETSVLLGLRLQAVRTRLHRARQALRTILARELMGQAGDRESRVSSRDEQRSCAVKDVASGDSANLDP